MFALVWLLAAGCVVEEAPPPVSTLVYTDGDEPVEIPVDATTRPDGREAVKGSELPLSELPELGSSGLSSTQAEVVTYALNTTVAPCEPCMEAGTSLARCMTQAHPTCGNLLAVARRGVRAGERLHETEHATKEELMMLLGELRFEEPWRELETGALPLLAGSGEADIQIVVVVDYDDPFSRKVSGAWSELMERYGEQIGWRLMHRPDVDRHPLGLSAAQAVAGFAALGVGREAHEALLGREGPLDEAALGPELASSLGITPEQLAPTREAAEARVKADQAMAAALGVRGTPSVFIDGYLVRGARDAAHYAAMIDRLLADRADPWPGE